MAQIKDERQYKAMLSRIDTLFFETDEQTTSDDPRLLELDLLSALVEGRSLGQGLPSLPPRTLRKPPRLLRCSLPFKRFALGNHRPSHDGKASKQSTSPGGIWPPRPSLGPL